MAQVPAYLTPAEAAAYLREKGFPITEDTLRRWCRSRHIAALKLPSGLYRIRTDRLDELLAGETPAAAAAAEIPAVAV